MRLSARAATSSLVKQMEAAESGIAGVVTDAMNDTVLWLKGEYRGQVESAGMGARLARTWRSQIYPKGRKSLNPAGYIWSAAPEIIDSFVRGASIRPVSGAKWLWIPTKNVPRRRRGGAYSSNMRRSRGTAMTPEEVELHFNAELELAFEGGKGFAFIDIVSGLRGGYRQATAGRLRGRRGIAPRKAQRILMFTLVRGVKMPRLFDLQGPADKATAMIVNRIEARWR